MIVGSDCKNPNSLNNFLNQIASSVALAKDVYSDLVEDNAILCCFLLPQEMTLWANKI